MPVEDNVKLRLLEFTLKAIHLSQSINQEGSTKAKDSCNVVFYESKLVTRIVFLLKVKIKVFFFLIYPVKNPNKEPLKIKLMTFPMLKATSITTLIINVSLACASTISYQITGS